MQEVYSLCKDFGPWLRSREFSRKKLAQVFLRMGKDPPLAVSARAIQPLYPVRHRVANGPRVVHPPKLELPITRVDDKRKKIFGPVGVCKKNGGGTSKPEFLRCLGKQKMLVLFGRCPLKMEAKECFGNILQLLCRQKRLRGSRKRGERGKDFRRDRARETGKHLLQTIS